MSGLWTIYRRELSGLFLAPLAWVVLCLALVVNGFVFVQYLAPVAMGGTGGDVRMSMSLVLAGDLFWWFTILMPPLLTMRMISEEARSGVLEFLLTAPVTDAAVVLGKLLAATTLMTVLWSSVLCYGLVSQALGTPPDWIPTLLGVCGATLVSALFCAIGLVASAATNTPLVAAFLAVVANLVVLLLPSLDQLLGLPPGHWMHVALGHMSVASQYRASFGVGVLDTKHAVFFVAWTGFFVFLATRLLETRRWR